MKSTGIVRKVDHLGRILLPKEMRGFLNLEAKQPLEFFVGEQEIYLKKYTPGCITCGNMENTKQFHKKPICLDCLDELRSF